MRAYRAKNRERVRAISRASGARIKPALRALKRAFILRWKLAAGCIDCGYASHACALDFDHMRDKRAGVAYLGSTGHSLRTLIREIQKCVVRCANCHRVATHG